MLRKTEDTVLIEANEVKENGAAAGDTVKGNEKDAVFQTKIGLVLSCLGCMVGTGNIWRFPRIVARNSEDEGGLVFLLVWLFFLIAWSIPMLLIEYGSGRYTRKAVIHTFRVFSGDKSIWCAAWVCIVPFAIAGYYSVVLGWCFYYFYYSISHELPTTEEAGKAIFDDFAVNGRWSILTHALAPLIAGLSVLKGVKTIERVNLFLVPMFLLIILFTFIWAISREYAGTGLQFLFTPSWGSFGNPRVWVDAVSQNAFDTGAGAGLMIAYSTFMNRRHGIVRYATLIPAMNNTVSLICGMMIFSTVFSTLTQSRAYIDKSEILRVLRDSGPASTGLTFIWIPVLFSSLGTFGRVLCVLFFLCLSMAGMTSLISNTELVAHTFADFGVHRHLGALLSALLIFLIGLPSALNIEFLTNQDFVWGFALVINGLMLVGMVITYGASRFRTEVINEFGVDDWTLPKVWQWAVKFVLPVEATAIIIWWAVDLITTTSQAGKDWYEWGVETFITTITEWATVLVLVILINVIVVCIRPYWLRKRDREENQLTIAYDHSYQSLDNSHRTTLSGNVPGRRMGVASERETGY